MKNFIQLFSLRDKFRKMRDDINENGFSNKYPSLMGNIVFNTTVNYKSAFFESLMTPVIEELNSKDRKMAPSTCYNQLKLRLTVSKPL